MIVIAQTNVLTQHNDVGRTGLNPTETTLTPANVNVNLFGKLYSIPIDGQSYAQPLYLSSLSIGGVNHSVLFVATEHDSVFAFDTKAQGAVLWQASLSSTAHGAAAGATSDPLSTTGCTDVQGPEYGIKSTPVIDPTTNTLYTMSRTFENGGVVQRLHALDVTTGNEKFGGPVVITAAVPGSGYDSVNGIVTFNPTWENQRPGLLLLNGTVYIAWGSVCDNSKWHGWIMGYSAATGALTHTVSFITTPNGSEGGIWMGGAGLAADTENGVSRIFVATANGSYDATLPYGTNTMDYSDDILALTQVASGLQVTDEFTPAVQAALSNADEDLGSGGVLVLPDNLPGAAHPHLALQIGKSGTLILVNRDNLGGYNTTLDGALQEVNTSGAFGGLWGIPAYWNGNVYFWPENSSLKQYTLTNGTLSTTPVAQGTPTEAVATAGHEFEGTTVSVSANGSSNPIVWANDWVNYGGSSIQYLYAFDATNVANLLWSSAQNPTRDGAGASQKWAMPTIADGKVYVASQGYIQVYGLLLADFSVSAAQSVVSIPPTSSANIPITVTKFGGFSGAVTLAASGMPSGVTASIVNGVLTLGVAASAPATSGEATITVTGTSGTLTHSISFLLNVSPAPFDVPVSVASSFDDYVIATDGVSPVNGGFDGAGYAYSAKLLGTSVTSNGIVYTLGAAGVADAVSSATIPIPATAGAVGPLNFLAAAAFGNQANQIFTLHYTDGTSSTFTQSISDWGSPQNYPGETIALSMAYRIVPGGSTQTGPFYVYAYSAPLTPGKVLASLTLPNNRSVVVLAVTLGPATSSTAQTIVFNPLAAQPLPESITLTATASSGLAVYYTSATPSVCTVAGSTVTTVAAGTCTITASQAGNNTYAAASPVSQSFAIQGTGSVAGYDVVLLVGQSNMVGLGTGTDDAGDAAADPRIFQWNPTAGAIMPAFDPLHQNSAPYNIGLGMTFAKAYAKHMAPNRKLLLVGAATGATGFAGGYWVTPSGPGVTSAISWINAAMAAAGANAHFVGILWHQGENDIAYGGASAYQTNLQTLIAYFRSNITGASSSTPFIAGEMVNAWLSTNVSTAATAAAQNVILNDFHTLPDTVPYTAWTSAAQLTSDPYYSTIHFSALSQRQFGRRYADKFFEASNNLPQPQVSQKWWAGTFYDDGRGLGSANTNAIPVNNPATVSGTVTATIDPLRGNVAKISQGQGWLSYQVPGKTFNGSYTKMAWFLPGATGYGNNLVSANNAGQIHFLFAQNLGSNQYLIGAGHSSGTVSLAASAQVTSPAGAWMNVALAYDATAKTMTLYLNGAVIATQSGVAAAPASTATALPVLIGSFGATGASAMDGEVAGGRVWNTALSAAQITAIYNYESVGTGNEPGFGIVVGAPSQAALSPAAPGIPYAVPALVAAVGGTVASLPVAIVSNNGFTGSPALAVTGLPAGATYTLSPTAANNYTFQISGVPTTSSAGAYPLVVTGTSSTASAQAAAMLCLSLPDSAGNLHVDLSCFFDRGHNLVTDGTTFTDGGLAGSTGFALSANLLGTTITSGTAQFSLGAPNGQNGLSSATVKVPAGAFSHLALLATGINGAQAAQVFTVNYTDGTTATVTQSLSDWGTPQSYAGETVASTMSYVDLANGTKVNATVHLYSYSFALNTAKTVASITLPNNSNVIVMAMTAMK